MQTDDFVGIFIVRRYFHLIPLAAVIALDTAAVLFSFFHFKNKLLFLFGITLAKISWLYYH